MRNIALFLKYNGTAYHGWQVQKNACTVAQTLEEAAALLVQTDQTVAEIMHLLGYSNRTYFYRIFQEKYGVTPREYRLQNRG